MASESRRSQMLRGVLDLCLLAVVVDEPAYGYEMTRRLRERGLSIVGEGSSIPCSAGSSAKDSSRHIARPVTEARRASTKAPRRVGGARW
jgi:hypothetical protein